MELFKRHRKSPLDVALDALGQAQRARSQAQRTKAATALATARTELAAAATAARPADLTNWSEARVEMLDRRLATAELELERSNA